MFATKPLAAAALVSVALLVGCGSSGGTSSSSPPPVATGPQVTGKPISPPKPRESINEAAKRITKTASSDNCAVVNRLTAVSRPYDACAGLQQLAGLPVSAAAAYGDGGGVIVYGSGETLRNAILILDSDGLYHIPVVDGANIEQSVGTKFASQFDTAAQDAVNALRGGDCDAFKKVAFARLGPGGTPDDVCTYVDQSLLTQFLATYPDVQPQRSGGNGYYAFYSVSSPEAYYTIVLARELASGVATGTPPLPSGAPEYGFVDAYQTNPTTTGTPPP